jgi:alanyl-tRNA synthetase
MYDFRGKSATIQTKKLYFDDPYQVEFEAKVVERKIHDGRPALILNQTCFYPESGGQPSDKGTINGVKVISVLEEGEAIIHLLEENISEEEIKGKIDWPTRFDYMQQHSGQHLLSQSFYELLGGETLSFHLGDESSTVEIDVREIHEEEIAKVERRANEIVFQDREIKTYFVPEEKIKDIPLRKPPQKIGLIRVVEIADFDYSACGGTHCRKTGEIGIVKILRWERIRNNLRFEFLCGQRAIEDYTQKARTLRQLTNQFTVSEHEVISSVEKIFDESKLSKKKLRKLQQKIAQYEAQEIIDKAKEKIIKEILAERTPEEAKFLALNIIHRGDFVVLYALKREKRGHFVLAAAENLNLDMRELVPLISPLIKGKGGGSSSLVEIAGAETENLMLALNKAYELVKEKLETKNG